MTSASAPFRYSKLQLTPAITSTAAGTATGRASAYGKVDSYGDTIEYGAYRETIPRFLQRGFIGWGHDWRDPVGMPIAAEERSDGLYVTWKWHSDADAQRKRGIVEERLAAGMFVGLSIGFDIENPARDTDYTTKNGQRVRVLKRIKLHEVSVVTVPADSFAGVTDAKSWTPTVNLDVLVARHHELMARYPEPPGGLTGRAKALVFLASIGATRLVADGGGR